MSEKKPEPTAEQIESAKQEIIDEVIKLKTEYSDVILGEVLDTNIKGQNINYKIRNGWFNFVNLLCERVKQLNRDNFMKSSVDLLESINKYQDEQLPIILSQDLNTRADVKLAEGVMDAILSEVQEQK